MDVVLLGRRWSAWSDRRRAAGTRRLVVLWVRHYQPGGKGAKTGGACWRGDGIIVGVLKYGENGRHPDSKLLVW